MIHLYQKIAQHVDIWRSNSYLSEEFPAISEILEWAHEEPTGSLRFLRHPQLRALEAYWYLRLIENTPHIFNLYLKLYPPHKDVSALIEALGISDKAFKTVNYSLDHLWERIKFDDDFVRDFNLESLRETLTLDYPSYILALAMGAGKTILIGAIIATEFSMALEYPSGSFVKNALVFAPGKTIIESLRELAEIPYEKLLPPRLHKAFSASVKLTFTRDGEKDIPIIRGSSFNMVVTNTEKIRIQKETIRKKGLENLFSGWKEDEIRTEIANLRLQAIASLPHLAVFSDEAHHTYGQSLNTELKKVRKTVDYLASNTNVVCVVNTTGTPYFKRHPLKDVVVWYGLSEGIRDGILKDLAGNILAYDFEGNAKNYVNHVIEDFFLSYGKVCLPNGSMAKIALYFPQTEDLRELKPVIDTMLIKIGQSPTVCLVNTSNEALTKQSDIDAFNRLNDPASPHRVILLVNKGTEGWNCPSLFACALVRRLKNSNNFVLQAATRCLRQVPGNTTKARVYLSKDNNSILDRQLQETYGETVSDLNRTGHETVHTKIILRKMDIPPLILSQLVRTVIRKDSAFSPLSLVRQEERSAGLIRTSYTLAKQQSTTSVLRQVGETTEIDSITETMDAYGMAIELAARYRVDYWEIYDELRRLYANEDIPLDHLKLISKQIEAQTCFYEIQEERVERALSLVKYDGFMKETDSLGRDIYTAEIIYPKDREKLLLKWDSLQQENPGNFGFHYSPYNFDSNPEKSFFEQVLAPLNLDPSEVEDVYFTGALTNPSKTDFFVEYKDDKGKWRRYTPDFVIRHKNSHVYIVEIKAERERGDSIDGETGKKAMALRKWEDLNPDRIRYQMIFTNTDTVTSDQVLAVCRSTKGSDE